jgi:uncharacterized protein YjiS (DUF1127 family)
MLTLVQIQPRTATHAPARRATPFSLVLETIAAWRSRNQARGALSRLDDRLLADIGLTREKQLAECAKPFWQA